jgi:hypothetical protein
VRSERHSRRRVSEEVRIDASHDRQAAGAVGIEHLFEQLGRLRSTDRR